jgi:RND family efflux transporter MFP subunit
MGVFLAALSGCGSAAPSAQTSHPPVTVSTPVGRKVIDRDDYEGRIAALETVEVRARVRGHLVKVNFQDGQLVKQGEQLFEIDPRPYKAALDAAEALRSSADASLELAKKEYNRYASLARTGAASREEVEVWLAKQATATAERQKAVASVEQAQLDLDFTKVVAPIDGKISRPLVTVGNLVNAGGGETLLTTIVSVDPVNVYFDIDERSLLKYRRDFGKKGELGASIKDLKIPVEVALEGDEGHPHKGVIDFAENHVNPGTGTIQVRAVLPNPDRFFDPGMRAKVRIPVSEPHEVMLVPERAIGSDQGRKFVYVVNAQNVVERRDVELGRVDEGMQIIKEGLTPTDWVVVNGVARVREGLKVDPQRTTLPGAKPVEAAPSSKN